MQQLRGAFPDSRPCRYAIFDRDSKFGQAVTELLTASGMKPTRINPAEWSCGTLDRELLKSGAKGMSDLALWNSAFIRSTASRIPIRDPGF